MAKDEITPARIEEAQTLRDRLAEAERENAALKAQVATVPPRELRHADKPETFRAPADRPIHFVHDGACYAAALHQLRENTREPAKPWAHAILLHDDGTLSDQHYSPVPYDPRRIDETWHWPDECAA